MILAKFRHQYPQGSLVSELVQIDRGTYIVKALVQVDSIVLATAHAGASTVEAAEDAAQERAIATLFLDHNPDISPHVLQDKELTAIAPQGGQTDPSEETSNRASNHKIVNFSKPQPAPVTPNQATTAKEASFPQPDIAPEASVASSAVNPGVNLEVSSPPPTETNLFGDTFAVETPSASLFPEELSNAPTTAVISSELEAMDFNEIKQKTDIEIKRLSWTKDQGKEFLMSRYGKRSRLHLTDEQLLEFLRYLETLPNPVK
jgi:hypothetical protein